jgi:23S rRNA C2498 (ribose-2'-O)-methylase RlmM
MISDVIAYPERCTELLDRWCEGNWASHMVVTMKFQGDEPDLDELDKAIRVVKSHDYDCRVKHFFNNKNEVTFMVSERGRSTIDLDVGSVTN